jgi:leucyl-tRNA synthetase
MALEWDESGIQGMRRWLGRLWQLVASSDSEGAVEDGGLHQAMKDAVKQVTEDLEHRHAFNTAIAALMTLSNSLRKATRSSPHWSEARDALFVMLAPLAPHIADEAFFVMHGSSVFDSKWPIVTNATSSSSVQTKFVAVSVLVNGKKRATLDLESDWMQHARAEPILNHIRKSSVGGKWIGTAKVTNVVIVAKQNMVNLVTDKN